MSLKAKIYIAAIISLGALTLVFGLSKWDVPDPVRFAWYLVLAIPASCLKVRLPGITVGTMSVLFLFLLGAIVELNLAQALVIGVVCVTIQSLWHSKFGASLVQVSFSVATAALAIAASDYGYRCAASVTGPVRVAVAVTIFFVINTLPIAVVIGLTERRSIGNVWKISYLWCYPYYLLGAGLVSVVKFSNHLMEWQEGVLIVPAVYIIYRSYQLYLKQLQNERNRAEEEHRHAAEVETAHVQTVAALNTAKAAHARLDAVFRASPLAFMTLDREGNVTDWNATAGQIFGWSADEVIGRSLPFTPGQSEEIRNVIERTRRGELISGVEMKQWRKDGSHFDAAIWTTALRDGEGVSGILVTVDDISVRKRLEGELRLSQKMEAVGRLAGGIAHDFNNLLTAIIGYNGLLMAKLQAPELLGHARHVQDGAERAAALTSRLLTFTRHQVSAPKLLNVNKCVFNIQNLLTRVIGEDIEIVTSPAPEPACIYLDPVEFDQVIMNLAVNARDAMPEGGKLFFETANVTVSAGEARETGFSPGDYVILRVRDTGSGMDAETKSRLFEPFFTTKEQGKGTGLGLSIIYGVVQQNGGFITVDSEPGAGSAFSLYFPRFSGLGITENSLPAPLPRGAEVGATILLVEDEPIVRQLAATVLRTHGYQVIEAGTPAEAIEIETKYRDSIDLLVTDVLMPGMRGNELVKRLGELRPELPVLYMSGYSDHTFLSSGALEGAHFLQKPFNAAQLVTAVGEALNGGFKALQNALGASVTPNLPSPESSEVESSTPVAVAPGHGTGPTILLVEDESVIRQLAATVLRTHGYHVIEAAVPVEAITLESQYRDSVNLLVTDVLMPGMHGNELVKRLRGLHPRLPVLYISGYSNSALFTLADPEGSWFLQKPFTAPELVRAVGEAIGSLAVPEPPQGDTCGSSQGR